MRILSMVLLSGSISLLVAQNPTPAPVAAKAPATPVVAQEKIMEGMVVSVDKATQSLVLNLRGKEYAFKAVAGSSVSVNGAAAAFESVTAGNGARVTYARDAKGDRVIRTISQSVAVPSVKKAAIKTVQAPVAQPAPAQKPAPMVQPAPAPAAVAPAPVAPRPAPVAAPAAPAPVAPKPAPVVAPAPAPAAPAAAPVPSPVAPRPAAK